MAMWVAMLTAGSRPADIPRPGVTGCGYHHPSMVRGNVPAGVGEGAGNVPFGFGNPSFWRGGPIVRNANVRLRGGDGSGRGDPFSRYPPPPSPSPAVPAFWPGSFASKRSGTGSVDCGGFSRVATAAQHAEIVIKAQIGCEVFVSAEAEAAIAVTVSVCFDDFLG
jgi:hypothetical protein